MTAFSPGDLVEYRSGDPKAPRKLGVVAEVLKPGRGNGRPRGGSARSVRLRVGPRVHICRPASYCTLVIPAAAVSPLPLRPLLS